MGCHRVENVASIAGAGSTPLLVQLLARDSDDVTNALASCALHAISDSSAGSRAAIAAAVQELADMSIECPAGEPR